MSSKLYCRPTNFIPAPEMRRSKHELLGFTLVVDSSTKSMKSIPAAETCVSSAILVLKIENSVPVPGTSDASNLYFK